MRQIIISSRRVRINRFYAMHIEMSHTCTHIHTSKTKAVYNVAAKRGGMMNVSECRTGRLLIRYPHNRGISARFVCKVQVYSGLL